MATEKGILGQSAPGATSLTDVYTVPTGKNATLRILVANRGGSAATFRVAVSPNGDTISSEHYVAYDEALPANSSVTSSSKMLGDGDVVRVYASNANLSFSVTGIEQDN